MRVEHHLLCLTWIGPNKWHSAVAQADMGNLDRHRHAIEDYDLMAPVELERLARIEDERNISTGRRLPSRPRPTGRVAPNSIIAAAVPAIAQFLEDSDDGRAFPLRPPGVLGQHLVQL